MKRTFVSRSLALSSALAAFVAIGAAGFPTVADDDKPAPEVLLDEDSVGSDRQDAGEAKPSDVKKEKARPDVVANRVVVKLREPISLSREPVNFDDIFKEGENPAPQAPVNANVAAKQAKRLFWLELKHALMISTVWQSAKAF